MESDLEILLIWTQLQICALHVNNDFVEQILQDKAKSHPDKN